MKDEHVEVILQVQSVIAIKIMTIVLFLEFYYQKLLKSFHK
jgi:hypothetical protein